MSYRLVFYEPVDSPHKDDLFRALAAHPAVASLTMIADTGMTPERIAQGWPAGADGPYAKLIAPSPGQLAAAIAEAGPDAVHVFSGMRHTECVVRGLRQCLAQGRRIGLMAEPRVREGAAGLARFAQSWLTEGALRRHAAFVLAIGRHGPDWFRRTGYPAERIVPFAYFLPGNPPPPPRLDGKRVAYVGRLEAHKGVPDLLRALPRVDPAASVEIVGAGSLAPACAAAARATRRGVIPMAAMRDYLGTVDVLVLPSRTTDEGWGAVVSEALFAGAAVVATDRVGASICLADPDRGRVVPRRDPAALAAAIDALLAAPQRTQAAREARSAFAHRHLTGAAGAARLVATLRHVYEDGPAPGPFLPALAPPRRPR